jgi:hypothetical protein
MPPVKAGILVALGYAAYMLLVRRRTTLALWMALGAVAWVGIVAAMTEGGFSGNERYLAMPVGLGCVLAGAGCAWAARGLGMLGARAFPGAARWTGPAAAVALLAVAIPFTVPRLAQLDSDDGVLQFQAKLRDQLGVAVDRYGGRERVLACGIPYAGAYNVAMVSWFLDVPGQTVSYQTWLPDSPPGVAFRARARRSVNPTPPVSKKGKPAAVRNWSPVVTNGEWTIYESCGP